jgi:hypothetical protein
VVEQELRGKINAISINGQDKQDEPEERLRIKERFYGGSDRIET